MLDTLSYYVGSHQLKTGFDFSSIDNKDESLPLHFGGRYIFAAALPGALLGLPVPGDQRHPGGGARAAGGVRAGLRQSRPTRIASAISRCSCRTTGGCRRTSRVKLGLRYQNQFWPDVEYTVRGIDAVRFPADGNNFAPRVAFAWDPLGDKRTSIHGAYGIFFDNHITALSGITNLINGSDQVRTLVAQLPNPLPIGAWNAPGRRLPERRSAPYPSLEISIDPGLETPYAHHASIGVDRELPGRDGAVGQLRLRARARAARHDRLQPDRAGARARAAGPRTSTARAGTSASILQYTSFGETWYRGLTLSLNKRFERPLPVPGELHAVEGRRQLDRLPERVHSRRTTAAAATGRI